MQKPEQCASLAPSGERYTTRTQQGADGNTDGDRTVFYYSWSPSRSSGSVVPSGTDLLLNHKDEDVKGLVNPVKLESMKPGCIMK